MAGLTKEEIQHFIEARHEDRKSTFIIEEVGARRARVRLLVDQRHLRHGDTVSGPALMALTDAATFFALLGEIGPVFDAVTSNLNINFLRKPAPVDIIAETRLLKIGKRLAFGEITLFSDGQDEPVAHATCTYSLPLK
ncbi:MAG: PaaI family thioesterase [bacterium]